MDGACQHEARRTVTRSPLPMVDGMGGIRDCDVATGMTHDTIEMMNHIQQQDRDRSTPRIAEGSIQWRSRYDGLVTIAELGGKAVAGISGPWSGQYALTWWDRPLPTRSLDLFNSLDDAKREVEGWARRMRTGNSSLSTASLLPARNLIGSPEAIIPGTGAAPSTGRVLASPQPTLLAWVRTFLPDLRQQKPNAAPAQSTERLRQQQACADTELDDDLHFSADK